MKDIQNFNQEKARKKFSNITFTEEDFTSTIEKLVEKLKNEKFRETKDSVFHKYYHGSGEDIDASSTIIFKKTNIITKELLDEMVNESKSGICAYNTVMFIMPIFDDISKELLLLYIKERLSFLVSHRTRNKKGFSPIILDESTNKIFFYQHKVFFHNEYKIGTNALLSRIRKNKK